MGNKGGEKYKAESFSLSHRFTDKLQETGKWKTVYGHLQTKP